MSHGHVDALSTGFRLSAQQERVWAQGKTPLWACCEVWIDGHVDSSRLRSAVGQVVASNEILRTVFQRQPGVTLPFQVIREAADFDWQSVDLSMVSKDAQACEITRASLEQRTRLRLDAGPVLGVLLADVGGRYCLELQIPSLCADSRTLQNLVAAVGAAYVGGEPAETLQYADFVEWQGELLASDDTKAGRAFWADYFREHPLAASTALLTAFETANGAEFDAQVCLLTVPAAELNAACLRLGAAPQDFFLAGWHAFSVSDDG